MVLNSSASGLTSSCKLRGSSLLRLWASSCESLMELRVLDFCLLYSRDLNGKIDSSYVTAVDGCYSV